MAKKQYVQFSKRMVVAVVLSDFLLCAAAVILAVYGHDMTGPAEVIRTYTDFAKVVFVAYSGNTAVEKWLIFTAKAKAAETAEETTSNG